VFLERTHSKDVTSLVAHRTCIVQSTGKELSHRPFVIAEMKPGATKSE